MLNADCEILTSCILCGSRDIFPYRQSVCLWKCQACGLVFDSPRPTAAAIGRYYSQQGKYREWLSVQQGIDTVAATRLKRILRYKQGGDLLDIGSGIGQFINQARSHFHCVGTEISTEGIEEARRVYGVELIQGTLDEIEFGDRQFDVITMTHVLEHMPYPGRALDRCLSLLRPGGIMYVAVPNEPPYSLRLVLPALLALAGVQRFASFRDGGWRRIALDGSMAEIHLSHFTDVTLRRALLTRGLRVVDGGPDYHDVFMHRRGFVQIPRRLMIACTAALWFVARINIYNCLWLLASKQPAP